MTNAISFGEILEAADRLSQNEQQDLISILSHRLAQTMRRRVAAEIEEARQELAEGRCLPVSPDDLMREILK